MPRVSGRGVTILNSHDVQHSKKMPVTQAKVPPQEHLVPLDLQFMRASGAGDVLMALAAVREYRLRHMDQTIEFATHRKHVDLAYGNPWVERVCAKEERGEFHHLEHDQSWSLREHAVISHLRNLGVEIAHPGTVNVTPDVYPTASDEQQAAALLQQLEQPRVVLHNAGQPSASWPHMEALVRMLVEAGWVCIQLGAKTDDVIAGTHDFRGLPWRVSAAVLERVNLCITGDTGLHHLAQAVDCPKILLQASCSRDMATCYPEDIIVRSGYNCRGPRPKRRVARCACGHTLFDDCGQRCLAAISPELVFEQVRAWRNAEQLEVSSNPTVSVLISTFNDQATIKASLDSVLSQERVSFEVIVVDDGSTDHTTRLIGEYATAPNCRAVRIQNRGLYHARNVGLRMARGQYVCTFDGDDIMLPGSLRCRVDRLKSSGRRWVVGACEHWWPENDRILIDADLDNSGVRKWRTSGSSMTDFMMRSNDLINIWPGSSLMWEQSIHDEIGLFRNSLNGDAVWVLQLLTICGEPAIIEQPVFRYRRRPHYAKEGQFVRGRAEEVEPGSMWKRCFNAWRESSC